MNPRENPLTSPVVPGRVSKQQRDALYLRRQRRSVRLVAGSGKGSARRQGQRRGRRGGIFG